MQTGFSLPQFCLISKVCLALLFVIASQTIFARVCYGQDKVTCPVYVDVPAVVRLTAADNVTTSQTLSIDASVISFDSALTASGEASVTWKGNTNSNNGFQVTVQRGAITGSASPQLANDLTVGGQPAPGGDNQATVMGEFTAGKSLPSISDTSPEPFCRSFQAGSAMFKVGLKLLAPAAHGKGTVNTVLTFVAASL